MDSWVLDKSLPVSGPQVHTLYNGDWTPAVLWAPLVLSSQSSRMLAGHLLPLHASPASFLCHRPAAPHTLLLGPPPAHLSSLPPSSGRCATTFSGASAMSGSRPSRPSAESGRGQGRRRYTTPTAGAALGREGGMRWPSLDSPLSSVPWPPQLAEPVCK